ncbi:MAG: hypothetical protein ABSC38_08110 [Verrucomicrobiia bacterium]
MKSHMNRKMKLGDAIKVVSQYARNDHEVGIVVADLIARGVIQFPGHHLRRARRA